MKTILVPTDFSSCAESALRYAIKLANKLPARIILMHSFHNPRSNAYVPAKMILNEKSAVQRNTERELAVLKEKVAALTLFEIELLDSPDPLLEEILALVKSRHIDIIVMGTQGIDHPMDGQFFGTNTSWVVERASCPVVVIPDDSSKTAISKIVYASEYLDSDAVNLKELTVIAGLFSARIEVVHVVSAQDEKANASMKRFSDRILAEVEYTDIDFTILEGRNVEEALRKHLEATRSDMLVLSTQYRSLIGKIFTRSLAKVMTLYLSLPIMVFHHDQQG